MSSDLFVKDVVSAIRNVVGSSPVPLHEPIFAGNEWKYLKECLDSSFVSSVGKFVDRFEKDIADFTGSKYAVAVVNGTAALHIALLLAEVARGDEVLIPSLTFVATANAVTYLGAVPHFVESDEKTLGMDPFAIRSYLNSIGEMKDGFLWNRITKRRIKAIVPMHTFGHPVDLDNLLLLAADFGLELVEDAAESLGSYYQGRHTGTFGRFATLSFNGNKTITTGGGGAILTQDEALAKRAKHLTTTAKLPHPWQYTHDEIGYNYRLPNLNAALGCAQLEMLPEFLSAKRRLFQQYKESFSKLDGIRIFEEPRGCKSNYWLQTVCLSQRRFEERENILKNTNESGLMTRPVWTLLHRLKPFQESPRMELPVAETLEKSLINIPSSANLPKKF
ncbi:LegC family aminotransferase [Leptospira adleri]|uniref:GDP-perosamine synthase n=1 Tax=Leptospira adleri TaxID=2023186 RepID=A0A2M9YPE8_9LEPT|nr:LegC family aminotransferase [Leptospira adleri]PJZ53389.1 aminotransferase DegT [Leptospira adleri]PJZ61832.1 aminotransferase DegT [Leptospira adleri]